MPETASSFLASWSTFYTMTGTAAASLTGLMFVVITLVTRRAARLRASPDGSAGLGTFSTPTVVHFCAALLVSALLTLPWHSLVYPSVLLAVAGLLGVAYVGQIMYRTKRLTFYIADREDWAWYAILPFLSYVALLVGAIALPTAAAQALFVLAFGALAQIFIGIRNAWDVVTYMTLADPEEQPPSSGAP